MSKGTRIALSKNKGTFTFILQVDDSAPNAREMTEKQAIDAFRRQAGLKSFYRLRGLFFKYSSEANGVLTRKEFEAAMADVGLKDKRLVKRLFQLYDRDGSELLDFREFCLGICSVIYAPLEERLRDLFRRTDGGRATAAELYREYLQLLPRHKASMPGAKIKAAAFAQVVIGLADVNKTGRVSVEDILVEGLRFRRTLHAIARSLGIGNGMARFSVTHYEGDVDREIDRDPTPDPSHRPTSVPSGQPLHRPISFRHVNRDVIMDRLRRHSDRQSSPSRLPLSPVVGLHVDYPPKYLERLTQPHALSQPLPHRKPTDLPWLDQSSLLSILNDPSPRQPPTSSPRFSTSPRPATHRVSPHRTPTAPTSTHTTPYTGHTYSSTSPPTALRPCLSEPGLRRLFCRQAARPLMSIPLGPLDDDDSPTLTTPHAPELSRSSASETSFSVLSYMVGEEPVSPSMKSRQQRSVPGASWLTDSSVSQSYKVASAGLA